MAADTLIMEWYRCILIWLSKMHNSKTLTLHWRSFLQGSCNTGRSTLSPIQYQPLMTSRLIKGKMIKFHSECIEVLPPKATRYLFYSLLLIDSIDYRVSSYAISTLIYQTPEYSTQKILWTNTLLCWSSDTLWTQEYYLTNWQVYPRTDCPRVQRLQVLTCAIRNSKVVSPKQKE